MEENTGREVKKFLLKDEELTQVTGGMGNYVVFCTCSDPQFDKSDKCTKCGKPKKSGYFRNFTPGSAF